MIWRTALSQNRAGTTPQTTNFQPVNTNPTQGASSYNSNESNLRYYQAPSISIGGTANSIQQQVNANSPYYGTGNNSAENQRIIQAAIHRQMMNDPAYNPSLRNANSSGYAMSNVDKFYTLINEIAQADHQRYVGNNNSTPNYSSKDFLTKVKPYQDALDILTNMLNGKRVISLKDAYFAIENAYGETYLSASEYNKIINQSSNFIKQWMAENKLNPKNNNDLNKAIQQFLSQPLTVSNIKSNTRKITDVITIEPPSTTTHLPFRYDYNDFTGEKDHRNYFLTKCLATGTGQCNSLPAVYLVLAEALGAYASLSIAPQHSFIQYLKGNGEVENYEPTSNWKISSQWYIDNLHISETAIRNEVYLTPYSKKQIIADCILQLAFGYHKKFGIADGKFALNCIKIAESQFPKKNNLSVYFTYSNYYASMLINAMRTSGINKISDIEKSPEAKKYYDLFRQNERRITELGYQELPVGLYEELTNEHEFGGQVQKSKHQTGKEKRNLFIQSN